MNNPARKAIVTGHSKGLGGAIAGELLSQGFDVLGLARSGNTVLAGRHGAHLVEVAIDLADTDALTNWLAGPDLARFLAGADLAVLVNNAGVVQPVGPLRVQSPADVARAVALNVAAPLMLSSAFAAVQPKPRDRRLLHVASGAARVAYAGWSVYCATKAALDHHARAVVVDGDDSLRVCSLAPGVIDTEMQAQVRASSLADFPLRERFEALHRDGALASPQDCARRLVAYLLGERYGADPVVDLRELT